MTIPNKGRLSCSHASEPGAGSGVKAGGGAVPLMVELLSRYPTRMESAPLSTYRFGDGVSAWSYMEVLAALRQVVANAGDDSSKVRMHSLRICAATTPAAGGNVSHRFIHRKGRWKSSEPSKVYSCNNIENAGIVSRKFALAPELGKQPSQGTVCWRTP